MKEYNTPELKIVSFHTENIITASGTDRLKSSITTPEGNTVEATGLGTVNYNSLMN